MLGKELGCLCRLPSCTVFMECVLRQPQRTDSASWSRSFDGSVPAVISTSLSPVRLPRDGPS